MSAFRTAGFAAAFCLAGLFSTRDAAAAPPEPAGPHPRMLLDAKTRAALKERAKDPGSATTRVVRQCTKVGSNLQQEAKNLYMGLDWAAHATNCALAWHATGDAAFAKTALHFFGALLDDWEVVGDKKGGDNVARHDSGYAIRAYGVHAALVYDWLHDAPGMTPELLAKARGRFQAWSDWYYGNGYRFKDPGTNYHAGYLFAATAMAIAQGSEAGPAGAKLWRHVHDQVWEKEMKPAAAQGALLDGGDWGEGWQYAPLAVASYSLAARAMIERGVALPEFERWTEQIVLRDIHARTPDDKGMFVGGDTQNEQPNLPPNPWTLYGAIAGPSSDTAAGWARAEVDRLGLKSEDKSFLLFEVLADARKVKPVPFPREKTSTFYLARGTGTFYARTSWGPSASWMAMQCTKKIEVDHLPPNAGNFVLTRGGDDLIVDPSPYGSLSSLTSNAPTVESAQLPPDYKPGQGFWADDTRYAWAYQTESGIVAARCDYADQYKFQETPSDVPMAKRDIVLVPAAGGDSTVVVVDRARTGGDTRNLFLRFRANAPLSLEGNAATGKKGASSLAIRTIHQSSGKPEVKAFTKSDCFKGDATRGNCRAARFPVTDYALTLKGPQPLAIHVIDAAGAPVMTSQPVVAAAPGGYRVITFDRPSRRATVVVGENGPQDKLSYRAPPGSHVVLDAPASATGFAEVSASAADGQCQVTVAPAASGGLAARPLAVVLSDKCEVKLDAAQTQPLVEAAAMIGPSSPAAVTPASTAGASSSATPPQVKSGRGCGGCGEAKSRRTTLFGDLLVVAAVALVVRRRR